MKKIISIFILLLANSVSASVPDIVAIVNDQPITKYDFEARKKMLAVLNNMDVSDQNINRSLTGATVNMLVEEELLIQYAKDMGMRISEEQILNAIKMIEQQNNMPPGGMSGMLKGRGVPIDSFKKQVTGELIKYNIANSISNSVTVSPAEIDVAIINSLMTDFSVDVWIFTAKENNNIANKQMQLLRKIIPNNCNKVEAKAFENFATGERYKGHLKTLHANTESIIHDTAIGERSSIYQEDDKLKMVLLCKKEANVSTENLDRLKTFLSNKKMSQKATRLFKNLRNKANIKIMLNN